MNMSKFENWADPNGKGCGGPCIDIYGMVLTRVYQWEGTMKGTVLPYICASECPIGYAWRRNAKRCIKIPLVSAKWFLRFTVCFICNFQDS